MRKKILFLTLFFPRIFCAQQTPEPAQDSINPYEVVIIEQVLLSLNKGTNIVFDINTLFDIDPIFNIVNAATISDNITGVVVAPSVVQSANTAANIVAAISTLDPVKVPLGYLVVLLQKWGFPFNPIVDPVILARLHASGAQHLNGVVYVPPARRDQALKAFFQPPITTYYLRLFDHSVFPVLQAHEYTTLQFVPYEY